MKLKFIINKYELAASIFRHRRMNSKDFSYWKTLENKLWQKYKDEPALYFIYPKHLDWALQTIRLNTKYKNLISQFRNVAGKLEEIYKVIFQTREFKKALKEAQQYLIKTERQWRKNEKFVFNYFKKILDLKLPNIEITIIITHPKLNQGHAFSKEKLIIWGHPENWENYSTIYIAHELLHILTEGKYKNFNIMHGLIELATDNELRIRLNKRGKYFQEGKFEVGHKNLRGLEKKILPLWKNFLPASSISLVTFENNIKK